MLINRIIKKIVNNHHLQYIKGDKNLYSNLSNEKKIFFLMTPSYGNLGDQAIELATEEFLKNNYSEYIIIKIHLEETYSKMKGIEKIISKNDLIVLQGGGNFGNLYLDVEKARQFIVRHLKNYNIISFPCTITFTNDSKGNKYLKKAKKIYRLNENFTIMCREAFSYEFSCKHFPNNKSILVPDMVLSMPQLNDIDRFNGEILLCLRTDKETRIGLMRNNIIKEVFKKYDKVSITDTQLFRGIDDEIKREEVFSMINYFNRSKLVITDRLHGMIFCYVSQTPCIVLPSNDNKIIGVYKWMNQCKYIKLITIDEVDSILAYADEVMGEKKEKINLYDSCFSLLREKINGN